MTRETNEPQSKVALKNWILWWRIDPDELQRQVTCYKTLRLIESGRGISFILLLLSAALTTVLIATGLMNSAAYLDVIIMIILSIFILKGHRWAILTAMGYWTLAKSFSIYESLRHLMFAVLFWLIYMRAFYLAYAVEKSRRANESQISTEHSIL